MTFPVRLPAGPKPTLARLLNLRDRVLTRLVVLGDVLALHPTHARTVELADLLWMLDRIEKIIRNLERTP